jgi:sterol desaturase/sphingolipid hydroxylase (fatty acid hydroxylase superfamily)
LLLLDLLRYLVHRCDHAVPLFWRFHALHVTTSGRHHPIEYALASAVYWLAVLVLDTPVDVVLSHGLALFAMAAIQKGNVRFPKRVECWLEPVLVTVDMYRIHHSISYSEANANFGAVFSVWDRLFGTYIRLARAQQEQIVFGVRELPRGDCLKPGAMLLTPWRLSPAAAD